MSILKTTLPMDIFRVAEREAAHAFDTMIQSFDDLITHRIEIPDNMTVKEYANNIRHFIDTIKYESESDSHKVSSQHLRIRSDKLEMRKLDYQNCFYKLAKHNPEIAFEFHMGGRCYIDGKELPISDNIELYVLLFNANVSLGCGFRYEERTYEELEMLIDRLGAEMMLEYYECMPKLVERIKEIASGPFVKSAAKVT